ncbi:hypothetical protein [Dasania marina]|uniref:hypothetical protein n=1 Tax=Dasania marina TaxID=471499 RepID=UPI0030DCB503|tara:strand:- start:24462 stop:24629 length:168 start_codon:yes stop_codon:yes gene_type:complete
MAKSTIAVIGYGMGNLYSVAGALEHVGDNVEVLACRYSSENKSPEAWRLMNRLER